MKLSKKNKKKVILGAVGALALMTVLSGTFAWLNYQDQRINRFKTQQITDGSVTINENFTPPEKWVPGTTIPKEVSVSNTGNENVLARISYEEVLNVLKEGGAQELKATPAASAADLPVKFNANAYADYARIPASAITVTGGGTLPADLVVKGKETFDPQTGLSGTYAFYYIYDKTAGKEKYQKVTAELSIASMGSEGSANTYTINNVNYHTYKGTENIVKDWAGDHTILGKKGEKYGVSYDYTAETLGVTLPSKTPASATNVPTAVPSLKGANYVGNIQADANLANATGGKILVTYGTLATAPTQPTDNKKWYYEPSDGYFYYLAEIKSGETTKDLIKEVTLDGTAGESYADVIFDLIVNLESIQAVKEAITAPDGWNLPANHPVLAQLQSQCAF